MDKIVKAMLSKGVTRKNFYNTDVPITEKEIYETLRYIPLDDLHRALDEQECYAQPQGFNIDELLDRLSVKGKLNFFPYVVKGTYALCIAYNRFICPVKDGFAFAVYDTPNADNVPIRTYFNADKIIELIEATDFVCGVDMRQLVFLYSFIAALTDNRTSYFVVEHAVADYMKDVQFESNDADALCFIEAWKQHTSNLEGGHYVFTEAWKKSNTDTPESTILKYLMLLFSNESKLPDTSYGCISQFDESTITYEDRKNLEVYEVGDGTILFWIDKNDIIVKVQQDVARTYRVNIPNIPFESASTKNIKKSKTLAIVKDVDCILTGQSEHDVYSQNKRYLLELAVTFALNLFGVRVDRDSAEVIVPRDNVTNHPEDYISFRGLNNFNPCIR